MGMAFLYLSAFESSRAFLIDNYGLTPSTLFIGTAALIFGIYLLLLNRFQQMATNPLAQLIKQVETNPLSNAFSAKAKVMEVDRFRYLLENRSLMVEKLEDRIHDIPKSGETSGLANKQRSNLNTRKYSNASSKVLTFIRGYPNFQ